MKTAEEKFSSQSKDGWTARCMHETRTEKDLKLEPVIDKRSEHFTVNLL
jgi:hypothetical protein